MIAFAGACSSQSSPKNKQVLSNRVILDLAAILNKHHRHFSADHLALLIFFIAALYRESCSSQDHVNHYPQSSCSPTFVIELSGNARRRTVDDEFPSAGPLRHY